ncbi:serum amyloid P-component-like [Thalassophryne amazonica]|uniref:serum amyloid P-component-like n=1 Tax=Thalassophryne amazonica TaxID=390379 RepID=UPI001471B5A7|nr:serum amyloid P-component-like [Thalassophryne amazonica]
MVLLILLMLTACAAAQQDLLGKMLTFPKQSNTAHVIMSNSSENMNAVTVCLRFFTDLCRSHTLFSAATPANDNALLIFKGSRKDKVLVYVNNEEVEFLAQDYVRNMWNSLCVTWESVSGLVQLWLNGKPSARKFASLGVNITGLPLIILGQDQDSQGGHFDIIQSFVGMITDLHMWNSVLLPCDIKRYMDDQNFPQGTVLNWSMLGFVTTGIVLAEDSQKSCLNNC